MADNKYKLQFTLSNGETINAGEIVAPQGPKGDKGDSADIPYSSSTPFMDGAGSVGSANTVARGDHRHPSDTSRQEKLVSGENIKTINGQSVLGSGDILISGGGTIDADTLNGLLSGSNGIVIVKNTAGDKVEVKIGEEFISTGFIMHALNGKYTTIKPTEIVVEANDAAYQEYIETDGKKIHHYEITSFNQGVPAVVDSVYLHQGNVKTINGQSIYGTGDVSVGGSKSYKHYLSIDFVHNTSSDTATIYMTDINYASVDISEAGGFVNACFPVQESPKYSAKYHEATGFYGSAPIVAIKYTGSKIYAVTVTSEKEITPSIGMWLISDYVVDVSTNMKPVTT